MDASGRKKKRPAGSCSSGGPLTRREEAICTRHSPGNPRLYHARVRSITDDNRARCFFRSRSIRKGFPRFFSHVLGDDHLMNVLLLTDDDFASRERSLIKRLEVGLSSEGVRMIQAIPSTVAHPDPAISAGVVSFAPDSLGWTPKGRCKALAQQIESRFGGEVARGIDVVHVLGRRWWTLAQNLAEHLESALVVEVWREQSISHASGLLGRVATLLLASDPGLHAILTERGLGEWSRVAPWGTHAVSSPREILQPGVRSVMLVASGSSPASIDPILGALRESLADHEQTLIFADAALCPRTRFWHSARTRGLLDKLSIIDDMEGRRDLVLTGDILIVPEPAGENRSILLDAMAHAMLVIAPRDGAIQPLVSEGSVRLVTPTSTWADLLRWAMSSPQEARRTAAMGWAFVREHRKVSAHVASVLDAYECVCSEGTLPFAARPRVR